MPELDLTLNLPCLHTQLHPWQNEYNSDERDSDRNREESVLDPHRRQHARESGRRVPEHRARVLRHGPGFQSVGYQGALLPLSLSLIHSLSLCFVGTD